MIRRGNIQNDKANSPGYVGRKLARDDVRMLVNTQGDKVLYSDDFGSTYSSMNTINAPYSFYVDNSHPSSIHCGDDWIIACNIARLTLYSAPGTAPIKPYNYSTQFTDVNGVKSLLDLNSTNNYIGNSAFISSDGTRRMVFGRFKFKDDDSVQSTFLSYYNGTWNRYRNWSSTFMYDAAVSDNLKKIVNVNEKSTNYGVTVSSLNPGTGYTIVRVALSGTGDVLYAIREKGLTQKNISEAWLSISYDMGSHWTNLVNLLPGNPNRYYTNRAQSSVATNAKGDCVAFIYHNTYFGWSPNRGAFFYITTLDYDLVYNQLSMDRSGYYLCITNTNIVMPMKYYASGELSTIYTMDMHTLESDEPDINEGFDKCAATAILR